MDSPFEKFRLSGRTSGRNPLKGAIAVPEEAFAGGW
jgi:hypothetical protein